MEPKKKRPRCITVPVTASSNPNKKEGRRVVISSKLLNTLRRIIS